MINLEEAKNLVDERMDALMWDDGPGYEAASNARSLLDDIEWIPLLFSTALYNSTYNYTTEQIKMTFENSSNVDFKEAEFTITYDYEQIPVTIYDWKQGQKKIVTAYYSIDRDLDEEFDPYMIDYEEESFEFELADPDQQMELESVIDGTVFEHDYYPGKKRKERYGGSGSYAGLSPAAYPDSHAGLYSSADSTKNADKAGQFDRQANVGSAANTNEPAKPGSIGNLKRQSGPSSIGNLNRPIYSSIMKESKDAEKTDGPAGEYKVRLSEKDGIYLIECPELGLTGEGLDNYEDTLKLARFMVSEMLLAGKPKKSAAAAAGDLTRDPAAEVADAVDGAGAQDADGESGQGSGSQIIKWEVIEPNISEYKAMVKDLSEKQYLDFETEEEAVERKERMDAAAVRMNNANAAAKSAALNAANNAANTESEGIGCILFMFITFVIIAILFVRCMGD